jgi:hypothetical protein
MLRSLACIALLFQLGHSGYIPPEVRDMAYPPAWRQAQFYGKAETRYAFEGYLKNGGPIRFRSALYEDSAGEYLLMDTAGSFFRIGDADTVRHRPADFDSLVGLEIKGSRDGYDTLRHTALVHEGHWMFPVITGKISLYANGPGDGAYAYMDLPGRGIGKYQDSLLFRELRTKKKPAGILETQRLCMTASILLFFGGGALLAAGILSSDQEKTDANGHTEHEFNPSPMIGAGVGMMAGAIIPFAMTRGRLEKAVRAYNE